MKRILLIDPYQINALDLRQDPDIIYLRYRKAAWGKVPPATIIDTESCITKDLLDEESLALFNLIKRQIVEDVDYASS
jgi:hypothetical protein